MIDRIVVIFDYVLLNMREKKGQKYFKHNFIVNFGIYNKEDKILLDLKNKY